MVKFKFKRWLRKWLGIDADYAEFSGLCGLCAANRRDSADLIQRVQVLEDASKPMNSVTNAICERIVALERRAQDTAPRAQGINRLRTISQEQGGFTDSMVGRVVK